MNYKEIASSIKNKSLQPIYFLAGNESYYIDQITNKAIFSVKGNDKKNFFGSAIIDLQVANNKQYTAMTEVRIEVMAAPIIKLLPDKRLKLNREEIFDLGQFVTDIDQPDLNGLTNQPVIGIQKRLSFRNPHHFA